MIDYKLAKELKEVGFPQEGNIMIIENGDIILHSYDHCYCPRCQGYEEFCIIPTLSELIEACGEEFGGISKELNYFRCWSKSDLKKHIIKIYTNGSTTEEAVAKLYIALNKK